jgi:hypothetical protein
MPDHTCLDAILSSLGGEPLPAASSGGFELTKTVVSASGELTLTGFARLAETDRDTAVFVIAGRNSHAETEFPARLHGEGPYREASARIPLQALAIAGDDLADVYFVSRGSGSETRTRVTWDRNTARWFPYRTKLGNLSLKRKAS